MSVNEDFYVSIKDDKFFNNIDDLFIQKKENEIDSTSSNKLQFDNSKKPTTKKLKGKDIITNKSIMLIGTRIEEMTYMKIDVVENSPKKLKSNTINVETNFVDENELNINIVDKINQPYSYEDILNNKNDLDYDRMLYTLIRGIDSCQRKKIWLTLCNIDNKVDDKKGNFITKMNLYNNTKDESYYKFKALLNKDIPRTNFCKLDSSIEKMIDEKIEKMLVYYLKKSSKNEYYEGMTHLLKVILIIIDGEEDENAYLLFEHLIKDFDLLKYVKGNFHKAINEIKFVTHLIKKKQPEFYNFLEKLDVRFNKKLDHH